MLKKRLTEHKVAGDKKNNGIAACAHGKQTRLRETTVMTTAKQYQKKRILEFLYIHRENLDRGLWKKFDFVVHG